MKWKGSGVSWTDAPDMEIIYSSVTGHTQRLPALVLCPFGCVCVVCCHLLAHK